MSLFEDDVDLLLLDNKMSNQPTKLLLADFRYYAALLEEDSSQLLLPLLDHLNDILDCHRGSAWLRGAVLTSIAAAFGDEEAARLDTLSWRLSATGQVWATTISRELRSFSFSQD